MYPSPQILEMAADGACRVRYEEDAAAAARFGGYERAAFLDALARRVVEVVAKLGRCLTSGGRLGERRVDLDHVVLGYEARGGPRKRAAQQRRIGRARPEVPVQ